MPDATGKHAVLVVDDNATARALAVGAVEAGGREAMSSPSGPAAVELYRANRGRIDLVLIDVAAPGLGGPRTLALLRGVDPAVPHRFTSGGRPPHPLPSGLDSGLGRPVVGCDAATGGAVPAPEGYGGPYTHGVPGAGRATGGGTRAGRANR